MWNCETGSLLTLSLLFMQTARQSCVAVGATRRTRARLDVQRCRRTVHQTPPLPVSVGQSATLEERGLLEPTES